MIDERSMFVVELDTDATVYVVLEDWNGLGDGSTTSSSSTFTFKKMCAPIEKKSDGSIRANENSVADGRISRVPP